MEEKEKDEAWEPVKGVPIKRDSRMMYDIPRGVIKLQLYLLLAEAGVANWYRTIMLAINKLETRWTAAVYRYTMHISCRIPTYTDESRVSKCVGFCKAL